jgi:hypothetical protein
MLDASLALSSCSSVALPLTWNFVSLPTLYEMPSNMIAKAVSGTRVSSSTMSLSADLPRLVIRLRIETDRVFPSGVLMVRLGMQGAPQNLMVTPAPRPAWVG